MILGEPDECVAEFQRWSEAVGAEYLSLCQLLWKLPPGGLAHQAATASSALTGNSVKIPSSNFAPSTSKPIRFRPPFNGRQRSLSLSDTLNTTRNALSRLFIRRVASVLNLTALNTDSRGFVVRGCAQRSEREVVEAHERLPVPKRRVGGI